MNVVALVGNLTRDPHYVDSKNGKIAHFDVATVVGYNTETKEERVEFVPVTAFSISEAMQKYLKKGRTISVRGRVGTDSFEKDGVKVYKSAVKVNNGGLRLVGPAPKKAEDSE